MSERKMHLVGYAIAGPIWHNNGGWRHPERIAQAPEKGKFGTLFFVDPTLRQVGHRYGVSRLTPAPVGTAETIADRMQDMFEQHCRDGLVIRRRDSVGRTPRENIRNQPTPAPMLLLGRRWP